MSETRSPLYLPSQTWALCEALAQALVARQATLATAESCTGGLIAAACTALSGSSLWFDRGFVTYSNDAKAQQLGVPVDLIEQHGAVSGPVAAAMALGALRQSKAQWSVAVTGVAGPTGGTPEKPVGTVWLAWAGPGTQHTHTERMQFKGDRATVRAHTVVYALQGLLSRLRATQQRI